MIVGEFLEKTKNCTDEYKIKISNFYSHIEDSRHIEQAHNSFMYKDYDLVFEIDWDSKSTVTLGEVREFIKNENIKEIDDIISWDSDDGNIIKFKRIIISEGTIIFV